MDNGIYTSNDFETFTLVTELDGATPTLATENSGSRTYLAGDIDINADVLDAVFAAPGNRWLVWDDTYIRIWQVATTPEGGHAELNQSWPATAIHPVTSEPVAVRLVEPSPPISPIDWYFGELARVTGELS